MRPQDAGSSEVSPALPRRSTITVAPDDSPAEITVLGIFAFVLRYRYVVLGFMLAGAAIGAGTGLLSRPTYTSRGAFMPQGRRVPGNLTGLAAQLGIAMPNTDGAQSPQFYADLVKSDVILRQLADSTYAISGSTTRAPLPTILDAPGDTPERRREAALPRLRRMMESTAAAKTGVVSFLVRSEDPLVSHQLADRAMGLVMQFNLENTQGQAAAERRFTERRLREVTAELKSAEDRLEYFLQRNRDFRNSPELTFQQERLARDVTLRQQLFTSLSQAYEQAKIEEVRDTPVLLIIERPGLPVWRDPRGTISKIIFGAVAGVLLGLLTASLRNGVAAARSAGATELTDVSDLAAGAWRDLRHPLRALREKSRRR